MGRRRTWERGAVLDRAMHVFWRGGYTATSMRDVLADTGAPPNGLYAEFPSKEVLFTESVAHYLARQRDWYERSLGGPAGLDALRAHFASYAYDDDFPGCLAVNALGERAVLPAASVEAMDAFFAWLADAYARHLRAAHEDGTLRADADPAALAAALVTFDLGLAVTGKLPALRGRLGDAANALLDAMTVSASRRT